MKSRTRASIAAVAAAVSLAGTVFVACGPRTPRGATESSSRGATLENTPWSLVRLGSEAIATREGSARPYLLLDPADHRLTGNAGCNRMTGDYTVAGDKLTFGPIASTKMACQSGMDTEQALLTALAATAAWRIEDGRLVLADASGGVLAELEAQSRR